MKYCLHEEPKPKKNIMFELIRIAKIDLAYSSITKFGGFVFSGFFYTN